MKIGVCGNLTIDELGRNGVRVCPGGSALFSSLAAASLGAKVSIVSSIGNDYPTKALLEMKRKGIDIARVENLDGNTTRFRISYRRTSRILELIHPGNRLSKGWFSGSFDAIHLGPVFREVGLEMLSNARRRCKFLSIDVQGLLRGLDAKGRVRLVKRNIDPFLTKCNVVKATEQEARALVPAGTLLSVARRLLRNGAEYAIITRGTLGCLLASNGGDMFHIPSIPNRRVVDQTGAGDIFIGSWITTLQFGKDPLWAGAVGAAFASLSVARIGLSKFRFSRTELFRRASWAYNNSKLLVN